MLSRIEPLATLPLFYKVDGKRIVLVGGSEPAAWKAELLLAAGGGVHAFADNFVPQFAELERRDGPGKLILHRRAWVSGDLDGAVLAIGAISGDSEAQAFVSAAHDAGVPVNVVDRPEFCAFQFGAIVNRSPLVVAISTDGAAPVFGQAIRSWVEQLLPAGFKQWAEAAKAWRREGERLGDTIGARRKFWERFADFAITHADRPPSVLDREKLIAENSDGGGAGSLTLVEVTSSDPEQLTLRAVRALRTADIILSGANVPQGILAYARREAERRILPGQASLAASRAASLAPSLAAGLAARRGEIEDSVKLGKRVVAVVPVEFGQSSAAGEILEGWENAGLQVVKVPGALAGPPVAVK